MKQKEFESSMEIIRGNLRNASHVSAKLMKEFEQEIKTAVKELRIDRITMSQIETIIERYKEFSEAAAFVSQEFRKLQVCIGAQTIADTEKET